MGKIIPFRKFKETNIIDFQKAVEKITLDELTCNENLPDTDENRCEFYHESSRGFRRELRQGNPDCACCVCEGYDEDCPAYNPRQ